ncbi:tetratricopeptide repeat protein [Sphingomonas crocodyli]|uniref:Tetratricopeptide repeat protein n=1 Tax=Sphingomonas crocodyli TaxID=1979270 RepID=A0A437MBC6_9SPHN|nr:tetratricopeptide repeat protein [Sphingomonas crocodyli]RVT94863.1 tetratricopeptide repeat protein [Sphingomonas crocodyli]
MARVITAIASYRSEIVRAFASPLARGPLMAALAASIMLAGCGSGTERATKAVARFDAAYAKRNYWVARLEINRALRLEDDVPEYWNRLGRVELALGQYLNAYTAYKNALMLDPRNIEAVQAVAELSFSGGSQDDALKYADQMLAREPRNLRMLAVKGSVALDRKQYDDARGIAEKMLAIDPTNENATILLARVTYASGDKDKAIALLEESLKTQGDSIPRLVALLDMYRAKDDFAPIEATYQRLFRLRPDDVDITLEYARNMYEYRRGDLAAPVLARLLRAKADDPRIEQRVVDLWTSMGDVVDIDQLRGLAASAGPELRITLGRLAIEQKRYQQAIDIVTPLTGAGPVGPANVEARAVLAGAYAGLGQIGRAKPMVDEILKFDGTNPRALLVRVQIDLAQKRFDDALKDAQAIVAKMPQDSGGRIMLARVYDARGDKTMAETHYARALAEISGAFDALAAYVHWLKANGQDARALDVARMFTRQNVNMTAGWALRGRLCMAARDANCLQSVIEGLERLRGTEKMRADLQADLDTLPKPPPLTVMLTPDQGAADFAPPGTAVPPPPTSGGTP